MKFLGEQMNENLKGSALKGNEERLSLEDRLYDSILYQLEVKKVFLSPDLSLIRLSQIVGTNTTYLSNVVNRRFGMNFRMLVNKYRIAHATRLMRDSEGKYELGTVIRQSGFASRSVFYDAFLRVKGVSPNRYLEQENER